MELICTVINQNITCKTKKVVADSKNYLTARFVFLTDEWEGHTKTAIFQNGNSVIHVLLEDDECAVPWEVIKTPSFSISVFAGDLITTDTVTINVSKSGYITGSVGTTPTPDIYTQIMDKLESLQIGVDENTVRVIIDEYMKANPIETLSEDDVNNIISNAGLANASDIPSVAGLASETYVSEAIKNDDTHVKITEFNSMANAYLSENLYINVKSFGAVGDGVTDDTQAFADAITNANGKTVAVPYGIYRVTNMHIDNIPFTMVGIGKPILKSNTNKDYTPIFNISNTSGINIQGVVFDGNKDIHGNDVNLACIYTTNCNDIEVYDCCFRNVSREALVLKGDSDNTHVHNCSFINTSALIWGENGSITNLLFEYNNASIGRINGIEIDTAYGKMSENLIIRNNNFFDFGGSVVQLYHSKNIKIHNNYAEKVSRFVLLADTAEQTYQVDDYSIDSIDIVANKVVNANKFLHSNANNNGVAYANITLENNIINETLASSFKCMDGIKLYHNIIKCDANPFYDFINTTNIVINGDRIDSPAAESTSSTNYGFSFDNAGKISVVDTIINSDVPLYTIKNKPSDFILSFDKVHGNFTDVSTFKWKYDSAYISACSNCVNTSNNPLQFSEPGVTGINVPAYDDYFVRELSSAKGFSTINSVSKNGRKITLLPLSQTITLRTGGNVVTKTGAETIISANTCIQFIFYNDKWYEL